MISRRNIRVKVMQVLYAAETAEESLRSGEYAKQLQKHFDLTRQLLVYFVHFITEVARYAEADARNRAAKHLPSTADLNVNTKLAGNEMLWKILESPAWKQVIKEDKPQHIDDSELVRKIYLELAEKDIYKRYIAVAGRERKDEKEILNFIFSELLLPSESFTSHVEEYFTNWNDDADMVVLLLTNFLTKGSPFNFQEIISKEKKDFGFLLLETAVDRKEITMDLIKPKLKNWDSERIAVLDMILMRMGVCEFLYFETIPPKVTINEYIDLAKVYSTPQSGQFVNGILDNIHKDLVREDKMHKVDFKTKG
ncbi:MAG: transcription antitermination factor NusB [Chitinophagaceae bacterium]|nr:transcription antitermination factor NusB [Chitinophagaceae bacterium]